MSSFPSVKAITRFSLFSFLFASLFLVSCKGQKAAVQDTPQSGLEDALLWKIERKDLPAPSYLFGTIHMIPSQDFFYPDGLEEAFGKSKKVVFEIDMDEMNDMGSLMSLMSNLMMDNGVTIKKLLPADEYQEVSDFFEAMGLPMFLVGNVKPMFLAMMAEVNMDPNAMDDEEIISYEMELYDKAQQTSKDVGGLETMAYQMSLFDSIPYREQAKMLVDAVRGTDPESDTYDETLNLYREQKVDAMAAMVADSSAGGNTDFEDLLLNNRNRNWIPVMAKKMAKDPVFFAVGAGHLGGEGGVIRLLRKEGYTVTPVSIAKSSGARKV